MTDKPTMSASEAKALEVARAREIVETLQREHDELLQIETGAAKHGYVLTPAKPQVITVETIGDLIDSYQGSPPHQALSHASRSHYDIMLGIIRTDLGSEQLAKLTTESFETWHTKWSEGGKKSMGHAKIKMVRLLVGFGTEALHDQECARLFGILSKLKFEAPKARTEHLSLAQSDRVRAKARELGRPSIAFAQAFQSDVGILQKDAIGEWIPIEGDGVSDITAKNMKWVRGIRWNEIGDDLVLRHPSEGWQTHVEFDLRKAPRVLDEFRQQFGFTIERSPRSVLPASGAIVVNEYDDLPWDAIEFRRWWRKVADECGLPRAVRNSDSRTRSNRLQEATGDKMEGRVAG